VEINRNLDATSGQWAKLKEEFSGDFEKIEKTADTAEEKQWTGETRTAALQMIKIFEEEMFPKLKATKELTEEIKALDAKFDAQVSIINRNMTEFTQSIQRESDAGDALV
jgi:methyl-accepting chemotaxis protein